MMAVDFLAISGVPAKSLTFCVMIRSIPSYFLIRFAKEYMKSRAIGYFSSMNRWASSMATTIFLLVLFLILLSLFRITSFSSHLRSNNIWALAVASFLFAISLWKSKVMNASVGENVVYPFHNEESLPPLLNLDR